jgi:hypothetical protein
LCVMYDREFFAWSGARTWCCCPIDFPANITTIETIAVRLI